MIRPLDVIWIWDGVIRPPGPKMVVCIEPALGLFFRINTDAKWQTAISLAKTPHHPFLHHDSHLECGDPLEIDDYVVEDALRRKGVIGRIDPSLVTPICAAVDAAATLSERDKQTIRRALMG